MDEYKSSSALNEFVHHHKLVGRNAIVFVGRVSIQTVQNNYNSPEMKIMVDLNDYNSMGRLMFLESELDPTLFPTDFDAKWQTFEHVEGIFLRITGTHTVNPMIGKYQVKIVPLSPTMA